MRSLISMIACMLAVTLPIRLSAQVADLVIHSANVLQCKAPNDQVQEGRVPSDPIQAIAIKDGRIRAIGSDEAIRQWIDERQTTVINAEGRTVTPGLIDSHMHFLGLGQSLQNLDVSGADNWQQVVDVNFWLRAQSPTPILCFFHVSNVLGW